MRTVEELQKIYYVEEELPRLNNWANTFWSRTGKKLKISQEYNENMKYALIC